MSFAPRSSDQVRRSRYSDAPWLSEALALWRQGRRPADVLRELQQRGVAGLPPHHVGMWRALHLAAGAQQLTPEAQSRARILAGLAPGASAPRRLEGAELEAYAAQLLERERCRQADAQRAVLRLVPQPPAPVRRPLSSSPGAPTCRPPEPLMQPEEQEEQQEEQHTVGDLTRLIRRVERLAAELLDAERQLDASIRQGQEALERSRALRQQPAAAPAAPAPAPGPEVEASGPASAEAAGDTARIRELVEARGEVSARDVADLLGTSQDLAGARLRYGAQCGHWRRVGRGRFAALGRRRAS